MNKYGLVMVGLFTVALLLGVTFAADYQSGDISHGGKWAVRSDGSAVFDGGVTASGTVTAATISGDIATDDINASGDTNDTLGINLPDPATNGKIGTVSIVSLDESGEVADNDYINLELLVGSDGTGGSETNTASYARAVVTKTDVTGGTEDGRLELSVVTAGTMTEVLQLEGNDATIAGDVTAATLGISEGHFDVVDITNLVFIATATNGVALDPFVTNSIDADILN